MIMNDMKKIITPVVLVCLLFIGCSKMDEPTRQYTKDGEIIYATRIDSLKAFPGNNRIKLTWLLPANSSAVKAIAYWDNKAKSREVPLIKGPDNTYAYILENMPEASYLFDVYTFDKENHISIKSTTNTVAYGEVYRKGLLNRLYIQTSKRDGKLVVNWNVPEKEMIGVEVQYTSTSNTVLSETTLGDSNETVISGTVDFTKPIKYRTIYNPGLKSIDTFAAEWSNTIDISNL